MDQPIEDVYPLDMVGTEQHIDRPGRCWDGNAEINTPVSIPLDRGGFRYAARASSARSVVCS